MGSWGKGNGNYWREVLVGEGQILFLTDDVFFIPLLDFPYILCPSINSLVLYPFPLSFTNAWNPFFVAFKKPYFPTEFYLIQDRSYFLWLLSLLYYQWMVLFSWIEPRTIQYSKILYLLTLKTNLPALSSSPIIQGGRKGKIVGFGSPLSPLTWVRQWTRALPVHGHFLITAALLYSPSPTI